MRHIDDSSYGASSERSSLQSSGRVIYACTKNKAQVAHRIVKAVIPVKRNVFPRPPSAPFPVARTVVRQATSPRLLRDPAHILHSPTRLPIPADTPTQSRNAERVLPSPPPAPPPSRLPEYRATAVVPDHPGSADHTRGLGAREADGVGRGGTKPVCREEEAWAGDSLMQRQMRRRRRRRSLELRRHLESEWRSGSGSMM